jgi:hypothetical protein
VRNNVVIQLLLPNQCYSCSHKNSKISIAATFCLISIILSGGKPFEEPNAYTKATMQLCLKNGLLPRFLAQLSSTDDKLVLYTCHGVLDLTYGFADEFIKAKIHEKMVKLARQVPRPVIHSTFLS